MKSPNSSSLRKGLPRSPLLLQTLPSCRESPGSWCAHRAGDEARTYLGVKCFLAKGAIPEQIICHLIHVVPTWCSSAWDSGSAAGKQGQGREYKNPNHVYPRANNGTKKSSKKIVKDYSIFILASFFFFFYFTGKATIGVSWHKRTL